MTSSLDKTVALWRLQVIFRQTLIIMLITAAALDNSEHELTGSWSSYSALKSRLSACAAVAWHSRSPALPQECPCFAETAEAAAAGGVHEATRLHLAAAPVFSLALDPAPASGGRQQVSPTFADRPGMKTASIILACRKCKITLC